MKKIGIAFLLVIAVLHLAGCNSGQIDELEKMHQSQIQDCQKEAESQQKRVSSLKAELESLKADSEDAAELQNKIIELEAENKELKIDFQNKMGELEAKNKDMASDFQKKIESLETDNKKLKSVVEDYKNRLSRSGEDSMYVETRDLLFWLVVRYDHAWIRYVNGGDDGFKNYVVKDSPIYKSTLNFRKTHPHLKEKLTLLQLEKVEINGNTANIYVYETVEWVSDPNIFHLHWKYYAEKIGGIWYLKVSTKLN